MYFNNDLLPVVPSDGGERRGIGNAQGGLDEDFSLRGWVVCDSEGGIRLLSEGGGWKGGKREGSG